VNTDVPGVIAIDGPAGAGKSTVSRAVAARLGITYLDTGAMYRAVTALVLDAGVDPRDTEAVVDIARRMVLVLGDGPVVANGADVTAEIRSTRVNAAVSYVASNAAVRAELVERQRAWARAKGGGVLEGRDIGSVVFPDAPLKVYLTASPAERARRRAAEAGGDVGEIAASIERRDHIDSTRDASPLVEAAGATLVDTDGLSIEQVVDRIVELFHAATGGSK
jgi:cytidylate kinase